jgi:hypothetical protein
MNTRKFLSLIVPLCLCLGLWSCSETPKPTLTLSATKVPHKAWVSVTGTGFAPKANVMSHLRKPNGTEFPVLPMLSNDRGEIFHEIDTLLLDKGTHDLWIVDDTTQLISNVVQFEVVN